MEIEKDKARLAMLEKIDLLEREGRFECDIEDDPPFEILDADKVDFLNRRLSSKIKRKIAYFGGWRFYRGLMKNKHVIYKGVKGLENLQGFSGGAMITCNHCHVFDNYVVLLGLKKHFKRLRLYKVIREGNYAMPGKIGFFMRHCDTLPVSKSINTMSRCLKSIETLLEKKQKVLIYPEQGMWWNYRKPRPLKIGAFKFAAKFGSPIIPCFITMQDSDIIGADGFYVQEFTLNIMPPIYPDPALTQSQNAENMRNKNYELCKQVYEQTYNKKLEYLS